MNYPTQVIYELADFLKKNAYFIDVLDDHNEEGEANIIGFEVNTQLLVKAIAEFYNNTHFNNAWE